MVLDRILDLCPVGVEYQSQGSARNATLGTHATVLGVTPKGLDSKAQGKRTAALG